MEKERRLSPSVSFSRGRATYTNLGINYRWLSRRYGKSWRSICYRRINHNEIWIVKFEGENFYDSINIERPWSLSSLARQSRNSTAPHGALPPLRPSAR